ncbi:hypothetical protein BJF93_03940 [Xaviernesmea oryzae]|uniref:Uncharacterized protein n=1 Tax=Xaviernesmea oryzae TaxID=464029 RepID=A0A1Q9AUH0_9HYPH|nr:hypothetical protein [Xaviernesmea oryzae]OLP59083.1 hypothetical protein BJF93_03940 [Xaviernesmea oryzae]SEK87479.1 hypothetical protein SAMN04487976_104255 [Xaviernesmea oryzae]
MLTHDAEGNGKGILEINGQSQPVSYELVVAREEDDTRRVRIRLMAPRDWLMKQGFSGEATLVRDNGSRVKVSHEGGVDVDDPIAVALEGHDSLKGGDAEIAEAYPELSN